MRNSIFVVMLSAALLAACANQQTHEIFTGPQTEAVTVQANDTVIVTYIDAVEQEAAFIGQKHSYRLAPGKHTLLIEYAALFQLDADRHEKIKSPPIKVTFEAQPGKTYAFRHPEQRTVEDAKAFAKAPSIELIMLPDQTPVVATFEQSLPMSFLQQIRFGNTESYGFASDRAEQAAASTTTSMSVPVSAAAPLPVSGVGSGTASGNSAGAESPQVVDAMKALWMKATPDQRRAFQEWLKIQ